ncbi:hypothetical protein DFP72DRAFT_848033 [Ephemerocybe angulata]|uniref:Uncharacterized protein n=1 Tax=Ephemerocybe angulata TaxID=980116 RepID=A0A8H6HZE7_9AGAR|nr:hypothetical protein DFP72DRAFT_848033 [Tulosesus angulatus]
MPVQRVSGHTSSGSRQGTKRVNTPTTPHRAKSFGPHSDGHPVLKTIATKDAARMAVNTLLKEAALRVAAPRPVDGLHPHHLGHPVTPPMVYYANNLDNFGRWYQVCKENCNSPKFLTASPARSTIWDNDEIVRLFLIREELFPTPRGIPSAQKSKEIARHNENLKRLQPYHEHVLKAKPQGTEIDSNDVTLVASTPTFTRASVSSPETRPSAQPHPMMDVFGKREEERTPCTTSLYKPSGNVFYWDEVGLSISSSTFRLTHLALSGAHAQRDSCIQTILQPDEGGFIRLSAHRILLGEAQIEILHKVERYIFEYEAWKPFPLEMPIGPIEGSGYPILIRKTALYFTLRENESAMARQIMLNFCPIQTLQLDPERGMGYCVHCIHTLELDPKQIPFVPASQHIASDTRRYTYTDIYTKMSRGKMTPGERAARESAEAEAKKRRPNLRTLGNTPPHGALEFDDTPPSTNSTSAFSLVVMMVVGSRGSLRNCQSGVDVQDDGVMSGWRGPLSNDVNKSRSV